MFITNMADVVMFQWVLYKYSYLHLSNVSPLVVQLVSIFFAELSFSFLHNYNIGMQGETTEQSCSSSQDKNIPMDPLPNTSSSSHQQTPAGQSDLFITTIPIGMLI